jgi:hypothetical protein
MDGFKGTVAGCEFRDTIFSERGGVLFCSFTLLFAGFVALWRFGSEPQPHGPAIIANSSPLPF